MADVGPYLLAVVTAVVAGVGGYVTRALATSSGGRTAARLVHQELKDNAEPIAHYRGSGRLHPEKLQSTTWDAQREALARLRDPTTFTSISEGYQALEGIAEIAKVAAGGEVPYKFRGKLDLAIERLVAALRASGKAGRLRGPEIEADVRPLFPRDVVAQTADVPRADGTERDYLGIPEVLAEAASLAGASSRADPAFPSAEVLTAPEAVAGAAGRVLHRWPDRQLRGKPRRLILDARNEYTVSGVIARREGEPDSGDVSVDEAYDALGVTYDFFYGEYGLDSYDGRGAELQAVVHYGHQYTNMFWDGSRIVYGDGDGTLFGRFTAGLDMTAHEFASAAVTQIVPLVFANQSGALLKSLADVFGVLVKQFRLQQTAEQADWLVGADFFVPETGIRALRSLRNPGTAYDSELLGRDSQPAHMRNYVKTEDDAGGVHINSGIASRAFCLTALAVGGFAWDTAGHIWYDALHDPKLTRRSGFRAFAGATVRAAGEYAEAVADAWESVGISTRVPAQRN